jgi:hypothetical protein
MTPPTLDNQESTNASHDQNNAVPYEAYSTTNKLNGETTRAEEESVRSNVIAGYDVPKV